MIKGCLLPYAIFAVIYVYINQGGLETAIKAVLYAMSYSQKLRTDISSVGQVYFILMIFVARLIYMIIAHISRSEMIKKMILVICVMYYGVWLGQEGNWLSWSIDCAMVAVGFYHVATDFKKYKVLKYVKEIICILYLVLLGVYHVFWKNGYRLSKIWKSWTRCVWNIVRHRADLYGAFRFRAKPAGNL